MANTCFLDRCREAGTAEREACNWAGNPWLKQDAGGSLHKVPVWPWGLLQGVKENGVRKSDFPASGHSRGGIRT